MLKNMVTLINMKKLSFLQKFLITIGSIILYYLIGRYFRITTGISDSYIYFQYPLLCIVSILFGPVIGFLTGFTGHIFVDFISLGRVWWGFAIASGSLGLILGIVSKFWLLKYNPHPLRELITATRVKYGIVIMSSNIIAFLLIASVLNVVIEGLSVEESIKLGFFAAFSDGLLSVVFVDLFFSSFRHTIIRRTLAIITLLNALILVSYGNRNIGSIILYILTLAFGLYLFFYKKLNFKSAKPWIRRLKIFVFSIFIVYIAEILFIAIFAYANKPIGNEKVAIVLGAGLNGEEPSVILKMRLDTAYEWALEDDNRIIITSGGQGSDEVISEGDAMRNYLIRKGLDADRVFAETRSSNTDENFRFSKKLIDELGYSGEPVIYVTNSFHCYRACGYAKRAGFSHAKTLAAPTPATGVIPNYLRESLALVKYFIT